MARLALVVMLWAAGCGPPPPAPELWVERVDYALAVDWGEVENVEGERRFTTDLDYEVVVESWSFRTTSVELVGCPEETVQWARWLSWSTPAHAHGLYDHDVSVVEGEWEQELVAGGELILGAALVERQRYCEAFHAHVLGESAESVSRVQGRIRSPGGSWMPMDALTPYAITGLPPAVQGEWDDELDPHHAKVVITLSPRRAFQGLQLDEGTPTELGFELGTRLARDSTMSWRMGSYAIE